MKKYYIGAAILLAAVAGLFIFVIVQGTSSKQDVETQKTASAIADKLNQYISANQKIPVSLQVAGITNTSSSITYTKLSENQYKFCVNYKHGSSWQGVDPTTLFTGSSITSQSGSSYYQQDYGYNPDQLYIDSYYHKGQNCQTVQPYFYQTTTDIYNCNTQTELTPYCSTLLNNYNYTTQ